MEAWPGRAGLPSGSRMLQNAAKGQTALSFAAAHGSSRVVQILLPLSDPNARDSLGRTALINAAARGDEACARMILAASDDKTVRARSKEGQSALTAAFDRDADAVLRLLIADGRWSLTEPGKDGLAPMERAWRDRAWRCVRILAIKNGAQEEIADRLAQALASGSPSPRALREAFEILGDLASAELNGQAAARLAESGPMPKTLARIEAAELRRALAASERPNGAKTTATTTPLAQAAKEAKEAKEAKGPGHEAQKQTASRETPRL
jgi:hypothetical protein